MLTEDVINQISNPILIINKAPNTSIENELLNSYNEFNISSKSLNPIITKFSINYRYDRSKKSEYSYERVWLNADGGYRIEIKEIHKSKIGQIFTYQNIPLQKLGNGGWFVTFEYDWWASKKPVSVPGGPSPKFVECRMDNPDEWYQRFYINFLYENAFTVSTKGLISIDFK